MVKSIKQLSTNQALAGYKEHFLHDDNSPFYIYYVNDTGILHRLTNVIKPKKFDFDKAFDKKGDKAIAHPYVIYSLAQNIDSKLCVTGGNGMFTSCYSSLALITKSNSKDEKGQDLFDASIYERSIDGKYHLLPEIKLQDKIPKSLIPEDKLHIVSDGKDIPNTI